MPDPVRVVVLKRNADTDKLRYEYAIIGCDSFSAGFTHKDGRRNWINEEIENALEDIESLLAKEPNGFYEVLGKFHMESWTSYEGEHDASWHLSELTFKPMEYDTATQFDDFDILEDYSVHLLKKDLMLDHYSVVNPFMTRREILTNYAEVLNMLLSNDGYWHSYLHVEKMDDKALKDFIFMTTLEIDSTELEHPERAQGAKEIHKMVEQVLQDHEGLMTDVPEPISSQEG